MSGPILHKPGPTESEACDGMFLVDEAQVNIQHLWLKDVTSDE
jgi:hypothetical protein